jgi:hypothetical protein
LACAKKQLDEREGDRGLRLLVFDGMCSQAMGAFTGGTVLVAFAVLLGGSNLVIGLLAAVDLVGVFFLTKVPEPRMNAEPSPDVMAVLTAPFRETNFCQLLFFIVGWNFAINLPAPFFTVYTLTRLKLPLALVLSLSVLSQVFNLVFFRIWGRMADRFSNKSVLGISGSTFVIRIIFWSYVRLKDVLTSNKGQFETKQLC